MRTRSLGARFLAVLLALSMSAPALLEARVTPTHGFDMFSPQEELQAGQQAQADVRRKLPLLPDSDPVVKYVQYVGAQLAAHAPGEKWPYSFHVVNQKEINAFALPGGPVYVNLGTIQAADNEAELAGVMAHEISHVVQRHGTRQATKQMAAQLPLAILGGLMGRGALPQAAQGTVLHQDPAARGITCASVSERPPRSRQPRSICFPGSSDARAEAVPYRQRRFPPDKAAGHGYEAAYRATNRRPAKIK